MQDKILFHEVDGGNVPDTATYVSLRTWISNTILDRGGTVGDINYIFCGDEYLLNLNVEYLSHDTLTDIITFPYAEFPLVHGDIYISTERVKDNAADFNCRYMDELHRVMIHGVLHLCGQLDKTDQDAKEMRRLEDFYLARREPILIEPDSPSI